MNDPHVEVLYYNIKHGEHVDYSKAAPLEHQEPAFTVRISDQRAEIEMREHFATADEARALVDPFLAEWELSAALTTRPDEFTFSYERAKVIDRDPPKGFALNAEVGEMAIIGEAVTLRLGRGKYPAAPIGFARDNTVDLMFMRYCRYFERRTTPGDAANFCLTMAEDAAGGPPGARARAAQYYTIDKDVLDTLGMLASIKGGTEARKAAGIASPHTDAERAWLEAAMKTIIRRAAEVVANPQATRPQITMADLPPL